jgi:hypothetical protein
MDIHPFQLWIGRLERPRQQEFETHQHLMLVVAVLAKRR